MKPSLFKLVLNQRLGLKCTAWLKESKSKYQLISQVESNEHDLPFVEMMG
jgi:hypothetical protein